MIEHKQITKKDPKARVKHMSKDQYRSYCEFRRLIWKAIDEKDDNFSIVKTAEELEPY